MTTVTPTLNRTLLLADDFSSAAGPLEFTLQSDQPSFRDVLESNQSAVTRVENMADDLQRADLARESGVSEPREAAVDRDVKATSADDALNSTQPDETPNGSMARTDKTPSGADAENRESTAQDTAQPAQDVPQSDTVAPSQDGNADRARENSDATGQGDPTAPSTSTEGSEQGDQTEASSHASLDAQASVSGGETPPVIEIVAGAVPEAPVQTPQGRDRPQRDGRRVRRAEGGRQAMQDRPTARTVSMNMPSPGQSDVGTTNTQSTDAVARILQQHAESAGTHSAADQSHLGTQDAPRLTPAGARALQVETTVQLDNLTMHSGLSGAGRAQNLAPTLAPVNSAQMGEAVNQLLTGDRGSTEETSFSNRVIRGLSAMINQRGGVMTMRLSPPDLGMLRVQMSIMQGTVNAQFTATTEQAQMMLDRSLPTLRAALEGNGLLVEKLSVTLAGPEQGTSARHDPGSGNQPQQQNSASDHDAAGRESRGRGEQQRDSEQRPNQRDDFDASLTGAAGAGMSFATQSEGGGEVA